MAFEVKVESAALMQQFAEMQERVNKLDDKLPQVFLDWQREDMKRKYPAVDQSSWMSVTTLVYPRSRRPRQARTGGGRTNNRKAQRRVIGVKRPILRPVLVEQLFTRMKAMCMEAIEWQ